MRKIQYIILSLIVLSVSITSMAWNYEFQAAVQDASWTAIDKLEKHAKRQSTYSAAALKTSMMTGTLSCTSDVDQNGIPLEAYLNAGLVTETLTCTIYLDAQGNDITDWAWPLLCAGEYLEQYFPGYSTYTYNSIPFDITGDLVVQPLTNHTYAYPYNPESNYLWIVNGGSIISGQGTSIVNVAWDNDGIGFVGVVEVMDGQCPGILVSELVVIGNVGIDQSTNADHFNIYPIPADEFVRINSDVYQHQCPISLYDLSGRLVNRSVMTGESHNLNTSDIQDGVYLLSVGRRVERIVIRH